MNEPTLQKVTKVAELLTARGDVITTAESCTGGGLAVALTAVPGSSRWFEGGFVTYSNRLKSQLLAVPPSLLEQYGAVSEAVVAAMVEGALQAAGAQLGVAISGIAGPGGGTPEKPVGTVCIAVGGLSSKRILTCNFSGDRNTVRERSVVQALEMLLQWLTENTK